MNSKTTPTATLDTNVLQEHWRVTTKGPILYANCLISVLVEN